MESRNSSDLCGPHGPASTAHGPPRHRGRHTYAGTRARPHVKLVRPIPLDPWSGCEGQVQLEVRRLPRWTDPGQPFLIGRPFWRKSRPHGAAQDFTYSEL